jgi:hypothetical protein
VKAKQGLKPLQALAITLVNEYNGQCIVGEQLTITGFYRLLYIANHVSGNSMKEVHFMNAFGGIWSTNIGWILKAFDRDLVISHDGSLCLGVFGETEAEALDMVRNDPAIAAVVDETMRLIEGWESELGLRLLSGLLWVYKQYGNAAVIDSETLTTLYMAGALSGVKESVAVLASKKIIAHEAGCSTR